MNALPAKLYAKDSATRQLQDASAPIPDTLLSRLLSDYPGDMAVLEAMIDRPSLPPAIVLRLLDLIDPAQRARLLARHPVPADAAREVGKRARARPAWWTAHLSAMFH